jgi:DnaJ family protein B protein 12
MEVNKEEALRCLQISQRHRSASNWPSALKFALKSVSLYPTPEGKAMVALIEREMSNAEANGASSSSAAGAPPTPSPRPSAGASSSSARATGVEEHLTSAHTRHPKKQASTETGSDSDKGKKREYTVKQLEVVTRIKRCRDHQYYEILAGEHTAVYSTTGVQLTQPSRAHMFRGRGQEGVQEAGAGIASGQERRAGR